MKKNPAPALKQYKLVSGWRPDMPDFRDKLYVRPNGLTSPTATPPDSDLRAVLPICYDQATLGSCVGNGVGGAMQYEQIIQGEHLGAPSRLFIYFCARDMEGTTHEDAGAQIRDGIKAVVKFGVCLEKAWPYNVDKFATRPTPKAYKSASKMEALQYFRVRSTNILDMWARLGVEKKPIVIGITAYAALESDEVAKTGVLPMPTLADKPIGGHCVLLVGYDKRKNAFLARNSWGPDWGIAGHFWIPFMYVCNADLCDDCWTLEKVS